jgi:hypothetical protein
MLRRIPTRMATKARYVLALILGMISVPEARADCFDYGVYMPTIGSLDTPGAAGRVAISGTVAYVADWGPGLQVIDVSNPSFPMILGNVDTPGSASAVTVSGTLAYVADDSSGLQIVDVSNPASPVILGSVDTPGLARGVTVSGTLAYVGDWESGLQIIDVSNPASPAIVGSLDTSGQTWGIAVSGNLAYVADYLSGFKVIDVSNPASPAIMDTLTTSGWPVGVALSGTLAYVTDEWGLQIIDVANPNHLSLLGSFHMEGMTFWDVALSGTMAYVAAGEGGLQLIDVSDPVSPDVVAGWGIPGQALGIAASGTLAFVAANTSGLQVIDTSIPVSPIIGKSEWLPDEIHGITVSGLVAYLAEWGAGLLLFDVSNPLNPRSLGGVNTPGHANDVAVSGNLAYVADGDAGLQVVDVSNLAHPVILGSVDTPGYAQSVALLGTRAYVADGSSLQIIDVSNPASPQITGVAGYNIHASDVAISGTVAYVTDFYSCTDVKTCPGGVHFPGLAVIDINPANPSYVTGRATPGVPNLVAVSGTFAYVVDSSPALHVFDISFPLSPIKRGSITLPSSPTDLAISGTVAYVASYFGLQVIDVSNSAAPVILGSLPTYKALSVGVSATSVCLGNYNRLLTLPLQCELPTPVRLSFFTASSQPNGMLLQWDTLIETEVSGFHVHRSMRLDGDYERLTTGWIRSGANYHFLDTDVTPGVTYYYRLEALDRTGNREFFGPVSARMEPGGSFRTQLGQAFPNPLSESTTIPFALVSAGNIRIRVLDLAGREVRVLLDAVAEPGEQSVIWNGRNERGERVPAGMYLYELQTPGFKATRKLVRLP